MYLISRMAMAVKLFVSLLYHTWDDHQKIVSFWSLGAKYTIISIFENNLWFFFYVNIDKKSRIKASNLLKI